MRVFGTKQIEPTDEDRVAAARLSAVAARFKGESSPELTEASPDPLGVLEAIDEAGVFEETAEPDADE